MENLLELNITDCLEITDLSMKKQYNAKDADSPLFGKFYKLYSYKGKAFAVNEESQFNIDFLTGDLEKVTLSDTEDGYSFLSHVSITRASKVHRTIIERKALTVEYIQSSRALSIADLEERA